MGEEIADLRKEVKRLREALATEAAKAPSPCTYPDCVDLAPDETCMRWLMGKCDPERKVRP